MKINTTILLFIVININSFSQSISTGISYNYLYSKQLDNSIQLYNFSRPFLQNQQPLFIHGVSADVAFVFKNNKRIKHGINATYSYFGSKAINENYSNRFNLHFINLEYLLHLVNEEKYKNLFGEIHIGLATSGLYRRINGEPFLMDNVKFKSLGIGGNIGMKIGYHLYRNHIHQVSAFAFLGYTPYLYAPNNEAVINATKELITKQYMFALNCKIGISYTFNKKKREDKKEQKQQ